MSSIHFVIDFLGFDPTRLAGRPTGYAFFYTLLLLFSIIVSSKVVLSTPASKANRIRNWCLLGSLLGLIWIITLQHFLFITYPHKKVIPSDTGIEEIYIVPIPLPILRSPEFDRLSVGTPQYKNIEPSAYEAEGLKPENALATITTVILHWLGLFITLSCLFSGIWLGLKSLIYAAISWIKTVT